MYLFFMVMCMEETARIRNKPRTAINLGLRQMIKDVHLDLPSALCI